MKIRVPKYFNDFKCIADKCEDTCCAGWGIVIDDDTYKKYCNVNSEFGHRLRKQIVNENGENIFILNNNNCPFLNEQKLCDIYSELGEEYLCYTCKQYPRYTEEFGKLREVGISLSCPEGARIILKSDEKVEFEVSENEEAISSYNDINALLFMELIQCRKIVFNILQDRSIELDKRLGIILLFTKEIQDKIDASNIGDIKIIREKYADKEVIEEKILELNKFNNKKTEKYNNIHEYINVFKNLKHITPNDPLGLDDALRFFWQSKDDEEIYLSKHEEFNNYYRNKSYKFENILVYYIFRYYLKAVFDYDLSAKVKTAIVSYIMIKELAIVRYIENEEFTDDHMVEISHMYSKDIEHLEENIESLAEIFETNDMFTVDEIITTVIN